MDVGDRLPDRGVRVAALHAAAARKPPRARRRRHAVQPVHAPRHDRFRREMGEDPGPAPDDEPVGGHLHDAHHRGRRQHEDPLQHRVRAGVRGAAANHRGVVRRVHLRRRGAFPAPQPQLHRRRVAGRRHRGGRVLHRDLGRVRGQGEGGWRVLRPGEGHRRRGQDDRGPQWPRHHRVRFQGAQSRARDSGHNAVDAEASFSRAHVEGRQVRLRHRRPLPVSCRRRRLLGLRRPDTSERDPERAVQVPQPGRVAPGGGAGDAAGGRQLPHHVPDIRHAGVRQHGGRVRAQEEPALPLVAARRVPGLLRRRQPPHRRRAALPLGARGAPRRDLAAGHARVPVLHVGGDHEAAERLGDVVRQLGAGKPRHGPQLRPHRRKPVGARGQGPACAVLQACRVPVERRMDGFQFV